MFLSRHSLSKCTYKYTFPLPSLFLAVSVLRRSLMDAAIQSSTDKIKVLAHEQYDSSDHLSPSTVPTDPLDLFRQWFTSVQSTVHEPEAMALSTVSADGIPSTRTVLLKEVDNHGFVFYTNYNSRKSREMDVNPYVSLALYWREVHRQVRVVGQVEKVSREESEAYFRSRPLGSRIGAWASNQSAAIADSELDQQVNRIKERFGVKEGDVEADIPLPDHWGGWRVIPL
jgi:pyridoxamine-phosphate oxidase